MPQVGTLYDPTHPDIAERLPEWAFGEFKVVAEMLAYTAPWLRATTTNLTDLTFYLNNPNNKFPGLQVWNLTLSRPVWASGAGATDVWVFADGTTAHTPV